MSTKAKFGTNYFRPLWCKEGECPNDEWHFQGASREVYGYLKLLARRNDGFVLAFANDITAHTVNWSGDREMFSDRHIKRILGRFRDLGVLGPWEQVQIRGRTRSGRRLYPHSEWAEIRGGICEFKKWEA